MAEQIQWRTEDEILEPMRTDPGAISDEVADVAIYVIRLADVLGIDLRDAIAWYRSWRIRALSVNKPLFATDVGASIWVPFFAHTRAPHRPVNGASYCGLLATAPLANQLRSR